MERDYNTRVLFIGTLHPELRKREERSIHVLIEIPKIHIFSFHG